VKRLKPEQRKKIVQTLIDKLKFDWLCRYGGWNRDMLFKELRQGIKNGALKTGVEK
jgi:hypothetical protein